MPAAAPRRIREVLRIIREPSGLRATMGLDRRVSRPCGTPHRVWVVCTARFGRLSPIICDGLTLPELAQVNGYPLRPCEQDMISVAGIEDQELTIIVSMMLIELALLGLEPRRVFQPCAA
jgi:hypothetical protein